MNKYSEVNKKETLLENVSFVSSGEDRKTSIKISKRWITLTLCLLLLSTIFGCVGLMMGFTRIESQEMEVLEEILKIVSETKHNGIGKKFTGDEARQWLQMQNAGRSSGCFEDHCVNACKDGWEEHNGHCYYLSASNNAKNWTAAEDFCQEQGGHLASMVDDSLKDHILEEMTKGGHDWIWLGGKVTQEKTTWNWVDCTPWNVTFWARGEPTMGHEECLTLVLNFPGYTHLNKRWNDKSCSYKGGYLCSKKICNGQDFVSKGKCQLELNTNLNGNDIGDGIEIGSWEACARLAAGTPGGKFWTWNEKGNKYCHVKSSDSGRMHYVGAKSGDIHCVK